MEKRESKMADLLTDGIAKEWSTYNARPYALAAMVTLEKAGYTIVPKEPTEAMWGNLARDIVMWTRFTGIPTGEGLHKHLRSIRPDPIPEWLTKEIPDTNQTPPKGTVAACIYKAMLEAALQ